MTSFGYSFLNPSKISCNPCFCSRLRLKKLSFKTICIPGPSPEYRVVLNITSKFSIDIFFIFPAFSFVVMTLTLSNAISTRFNCSTSSFSEYRIASTIYKILPRRGKLCLPLFYHLTTSDYITKLYVLIMAIILYQRHKQILDFLKQYIQAHGSGPTLREIGNAMGVNSLATVHEHLETLQAKALIKRQPGKNRTIEVLGDFAEEGLLRPFTVPILGFIAAGSTLEPYTDPNASIGIPPSFASGRKRVYVLQVRGESMIEEQLI